MFIEILLYTGEERDLWFYNQKICIHKTFRGKEEWEY